MSHTPRHIALTGVSRGLGRAMVDEFVRRGHTVFGCARSESAIEELTQIYPAPSAFETVDVTDDRQVLDWAEHVLGAGGPPDLLINNAAVINRNAPLWEVPAEEFSDLIDANIKGTAAVVRAFVPAMIQRGQGIVVNFSSGWGRSVAAEVAPYCASKWAIEGLTLALAEELPRGMAAVPLNPGIIDTDMLRSCFGDDASSYVSPEAWAARAVPFLLNLGPSDNGRSLSVPGS
ncbi:MAG: SDR family oxidoreductase [Pirellulales bacterium]|nr:SDR family oxidoreductase [Pirellulales bacterium]